jgi:alkanesulfonate monooxygenase SsuD/methylene tetrahydromethanopterin reductase-like flavin-dependent oxidoreductase (luciferase family)
VEAFGTIDALYPGRIDLGLGRSGQRRAEAMAGKDEPVAPRDPTVIEGTLFPTPFRAAQVILSERFAAAGSVLQQPGAQSPGFDDQLDDVIALLAGKFETENGVHLSATPGEGAAVELWLFGSSGGQSARTAGVLGLPFVANYHVIPGTTLDAVAAYRSAFTP